MIRASKPEDAVPLAAPPRTIRRVWGYLLAGLGAVAALAIVIVFSFAPAASGLVPVAFDRIQVMAPGEQHQARHPSSSNWSLGFAEQFRFDVETARQRKAGVDSQRGSPAERQWHFNLTAQESRGEPLALFIANAAGPLSLHVNGVRLADGSAQPAYFGTGIGGTLLATPLPGRDLNLDLNRIDVIQSGDDGHVGIRGFYLGSPAAVSAARRGFESWLGWHRNSAVLAAAIGLCGLLLLLFLPDRPHVTIAALAWLGAAQLIALSGFAAQALPPWGSAALSVAASVAIVAGQRRPSDWSGYLVLGLAVPALLGGLAGLALSAGTWLVPMPFAALQLANAGARPLLIFGTPVLAWRATSAIIGRLRQTRIDLLDKERIIAQQQQALDAEIRNATILEERQRFARDMHDGIGGHLQALLMRVRANRIPTGEIASELQSGLADLRLMVDSLDQLDTSLDLALENFRMRAGPQLDAAAIALDWRVSDAVGTVTLDPRATLSIYRILQEIVTNCVRHSGAATLRISIDFDRAAGMLSATIEDNGRGFVQSAGKAGKGLSNLTQRVAKLGGNLALVSAPGAGTKIGVQLPVSAGSS